MGNCSNISNTQTVSLSSGTITSGFCHTSLQTTYEEFIARTTASLSGNLAGFTAGDDTPDAGDQDKLWFKQNASDCNDALGWYYYNTTSTSWVPLKTPVSSLADNTQGDIIYYGASGAPATLGAGTDGYYLKTRGAGQNPEWGEVSVTPSIKAIRSEIAGSDTYYGTADINDGATNLATGTAISLDASSSYYLEWAVNVAEDADPTNVTDSMDGEVQISTDGASYTKMFDVKLYERRTGGAGMAQHRTCHVGFCHKLITNSTGGSYYFRFETNDGTLWHVHDFSLKVMEGVDYAGQTYTQS